MLTYKNNDPYIEGTSLYDLVKVCQTPFYVYSQEKIINQAVSYTHLTLPTTPYV